MQATLVTGQIIGLILSLSGGETSGAPDRFYVRAEKRSVYVFRDLKSYEDFDLAKCMNAVAPRKTDLARLRSASRKHRGIKLAWREHPQYFDRRGFSEDYQLNWNFKGFPLNPLCEDKRLLEITTVR